MKLYNYFQDQEDIMNSSIVFSLIVLSFSSMAGSFKLPALITDKIKNSTYVRMLILLMISYSATQEIEYAVLTTCIFISVMYLLKTPEERKKYPLI